MKPKALYFLAIIPPDPVYEQVMDVKTYFKERYNCKAPLRSPAHITLHMPFRFKEENEETLINKLEGFTQTQEAFGLETRGFGAFEPRVIYVALEESSPLRELQKELSLLARRELGLFNPDYKNRGFNPHMTVAFRDLKKSLFTEAWDEFKAKAFDYSFEVNSIWLLVHDGRQWQRKREFLLSL